MSDYQLYKLIAFIGFIVFFAAKRNGLAIVWLIVYMCMGVFSVYHAKADDTNSAYADRAVAESKGE